MKESGTPEYPAFPTYDFLRYSGILNTLQDSIYSRYSVTPITFGDRYSNVLYCHTQLFGQYILYGVLRNTPHLLRPTLYDTLYFGGDNTPSTRYFWLPILQVPWVLLEIARAVPTGLTAPSKLCAAAALPPSPMYLPGPKHPILSQCGSQGVICTLLCTGHPLRSVRVGVPLAGRYRTTVDLLMEQYSRGKTEFGLGCTDRCTDCCKSRVEI